MTVDESLPGQELFDGEGIPVTGFFQTDDAATDGSHHLGLTPDDPTFGIRRGKVGGKQDFAMAVIGESRGAKLLIHHASVCNPFAHAAKFNVIRLNKALKRKMKNIDNFPLILTTKQAGPMRFVAPGRMSTDDEIRRLPLAVDQLLQHLVGGRNDLGIRGIGALGDDQIAELRRDIHRRAF